MAKIKITLNEKDNDIEVSASAPKITSTTWVPKERIEKYERGEIPNDPLHSAISCVRQEVEKYLLKYEM